MKTPTLKNLPNPTLLQSAFALPKKGTVKRSPNKLIYLDIDNNYIHDLFPLLKNPNLTKPNYFNKDSAGAHITIIYPEETHRFKMEDLNQEHKFIIKDLISVEIGNKIYIALLVESPTLLALRRKYGLPDLLSFKGYKIGFHITIANEMINWMKIKPSVSLQRY